MVVLKEVCYLFPNKVYKKIDVLFISFCKMEQMSQVYSDNTSESGSSPLNPNTQSKIIIPKLTLDKSSIIQYNRVNPLIGNNMIGNRINPLLVNSTNMVNNMVKTTNNKKGSKIGCIKCGKEFYEETLNKRDGYCFRCDPNKNSPSGAVKSSSSPKGICQGCNHEFTVTTLKKNGGSHCTRCFKTLIQPTTGSVMPMVPSCSIIEKQLAIILSGIPEEDKPLICNKVQEDITEDIVTKYRYQVHEYYPLEPIIISCISEIIIGHINVSNGKIVINPHMGQIIQSGWSKWFHQNYDKIFDNNVSLKDMIICKVIGKCFSLNQDLVILE